MKKNTFIVVGIILVIVLLVICMVLPQRKDKFDKNTLGIDYTIDGNETSLKYKTDNPVVAMYIDNYGSIVMELYPDIAPNTVNNFISLVKSGFYDYNSFHRLDKDFVLQGGDPTGTGTGGPGYKIAGEFTSNGFENNLSHEKWVVSMARGSDFNSAGSQFFICLGDDTKLDGQYAAFGKVIDGFENIEDIVSKEVVADKTTGKLETNLVIKKAVIDLKNKKYSDVVKQD